jgi:hypothetical protein
MQGMPESQISLQGWIEQLRFEVQTPTNYVQAFYNAAMVSLVFFSIMLTFMAVGSIQPSILSIAVFAILLAIVLWWAVGRAGIRDDLAGEYRELLRAVYLGGLDTKEVAMRYEALKQKEAAKLKSWWSGLGFP